MIRGAQKKMIVIRTHDSRVFEEAYFVIRRDTDGMMDNCDMLTEADRIIRRNTAGAHVTDSPSRRLPPWLARASWIMVGFLAGSGGTALLLLVI